MSDDERWELHDRLAEGLSADPGQAAALGEALGLPADEVDDVARALAALGAATELDPPDPTLVDPLGAGARIGDYEVRERIGRGGFGVVYRARDPVLDVDVALKLISAPPGVEGEVQERFAREARAVARLDHPHVVRVRAAGWDARGPYLVMDYVAGESLHRRLERDGPLPPAEAVAIARQLADALDHAHGQGVLHRDVKPDNVLLTSEGVAQLTDFGLARDALAGSTSQVSQDGHALGTPGYWPPEQARGDLEAIGPASDVYGLGATLYALLTGRAPYTGPHTLAILEAMARRAPIPPPSSLRPEVDGGLDAVCARCLAHDPQARFPTARALGEALAAWDPDSAPASRARPALVLLALAAPVLLAAGALAWTGGQRPAPPVTVDPLATAEIESSISAEVATGAADDDPPPGPWWERRPTWRQLEVSGPEVNGEATFVSDPVAARVLLFGGLSRKTPQGALWAWDGEAWRELPTTSPGPEPRAGAAGLYDLRRRRLVIVGGRGANGFCSDLWEWDGAGWTTAALPPDVSPRRPAAAFDAARGVCVVLFGRELWEWDGERWTSKPSPPVSGRQLLYLAVRQRIQLLGQDGRLWDYDGESWNGASAPLPGSKLRFAWAVAAGDDAVVALAGPRLERKRSGRLETWLYRDGRWTRLEAGDPGQQVLAGLAWLPGRDQALTLGGARKRRSPVHTIVLAPR